MKRFLEGDENTTQWGHWLRASGAALGESAGTVYGGYGAVGKWAGLGLGAGLSRITGNGDYQVNSLISNAGGQGNVSFGNGSIRITHREFIKDIQSSTLFSIEGLEINPGLKETFPFLSQLAANFECYNMHGLVFEYRPTCGDAIASTNNAMGVVIQCVQYNSTNTLFPNKQSMEAYEGAVSCAPYNGAICGVECAMGALPLKRLYIRTDAVPAGQDEKMYDMGDYSIATVGQQNVNTIGELWVAYDITLSLPKLFTNVGASIDFEHYRATTGLTSLNFWGTNRYAYTPIENIALSFPTGTTCVLDPNIQPGNYLVIYYIEGTLTANLGYPTFSFTNGLTASNFIGSTHQYFNMISGTGVSSIGANCVASFTCDGSMRNYTITLFWNGTYVTSPINMDFFIIQAPLGFT